MGGVNRVKRSRGAITTSNYQNLKEICITKPRAYTSTSLSKPTYAKHNNKPKFD
jgi:hypothetical protein